MPVGQTRDQLPHSEADCPVWDCLGERPAPEIDSNFASHVAAIAAETPQSRALLGRFLSPALALPATAAACWAIALLPKAAAPTDLTPAVAEVDQVGPALGYEIVAVDYIDYIDEIAALETPALLSDADLVDLLVGDGSSGLLF